MSQRSTKAPAITRVHKLFRLRTLVNDISRFDPTNEEGVRTRDIGEILVDRKLSNTSILESANKLKRARDHALNASILGLMVPIPEGRGFRYVKSSAGKLLSEFSFENECPYNLHESAIFVDRLMRLKLTNPYDSRHTYSKFRTRPFLSLLKILKHRTLHKAQIHYLLSIHKDLYIYPEVATELLNTFSQYRSYNEDEIERFLEDHDLSDHKTRREIDRSTKPLLAWAQQGRLLMADREGWCNILDNGKEAEEHYSHITPVWYDQLGFNAPLQSALLILYQHAYDNDLKISTRELPGEYQEALEELTSIHDLWNRRRSMLKNPIDFTLDYDIPFRHRAEAEAHIQKLTNKLNLPEYDLDTATLHSVSQLESILEQTIAEITFSSLGKAFGIRIPRQECFQTLLEWETCIRLRMFGLPAAPYQGEYTGETSLPIASDNPDVVIRNNIKTLVECKSSSEWGNTVRLGKRVGGEIMMYQKYAEEINADSAFFVCEVSEFHPKHFVDTFTRLGNQLNKIIIANWAYLEKALHSPPTIAKLKKILKDPEKTEPSHRILAVTP